MKFSRCFELLNKTNQFNTTGKRWTFAEIEEFFAKGGVIVALDVRDKFTPYGITALVLVSGDHIEQMVMEACRVLGFDIECAAIGLACNLILAQGNATVTGKIIETEKNCLARNLFQKMSFKDAGEGVWKRVLEGPLPRPEHIRLDRLMAGHTSLCASVSC